MPDHVKKRIWKIPHVEEEFIWLLRFIPSHEEITLIDIGGNSGYWAEEFLQFYPNSKVYGFEPILEMFQEYQNRFSGNSAVHIYNTALGSEDTEAVMNTSMGHYLSSFHEYDASLKDKNVNFINKEKVVIKKLDNFYPGIEFMNKTVVKIDVQGFEAHVVKGGLKVIEKADLIILECSFVEEYQGQLPTFGEIVPIFRNLGLHPICFGVFDKTRGPIAYERNVLFVKKKYFNQIWKY